MKPLIVGLAVIILYSMFIVYQQDNNMYIRQLENLKYVADEAAASGALFFDEVEYSEGRKVYKKSESNKAIEFMIKDLLKLDNSFKPLSNSYWSDTIEYDVYYFDDSKTMTQYKNNNLVKIEPFSSYGFMFEDPKAVYIKYIDEPTVIVTINAGKPNFRLSFINTTDTYRSSGYEYLGR